MRKKNKNYKSERERAMYDLKKQIERQDEVLNEQSIAIKNVQNFLYAQEKSHNNHITLLANFARHDLKNYIQSMDGIISVGKINNNIDIRGIESLEKNIESMREVLNNFAQLTPYSESEHTMFSVSSLFTAVEALNRSHLQNKKIEIEKDYPDLSLNIRGNFQTFIQILNNLVLNAEKAISDLKCAERKIKFSYEYDSENSHVLLKVTDTAPEIEEDQLEKIFEFGYSTTEGSGIGLFHIQCICTDLKSNVYTESVTDFPYKKSFIIQIPVENLDHV